MREFVEPEFHYIRNTGNLSCEEIARLSDEELAQYLKDNRFAEAKKRYQISSGYLLRQVGGEAAIVPVDAECVIQNAVMTPNGPATFLWNAFMTPSTEEDVVQKGLADYEGPEKQIREDVHRFVQESLKYKILMEVM